MFSMYPRPSNGITDRLYTDLYMGPGGLHPGFHTCAADILLTEQPSTLQWSGKSHTTTVRPSVLIKDYSYWSVCQILPTVMKLVNVECQMGNK